MIMRRLPILAVTVVGLGVIVLAARDTQEPVEATFAPVPGPWMPAASPAGGLTTTWFCPGVPGGGETDVGGKLRRGQRRRDRR